MITISREEFKVDPTFRKLYEFILEHHEVAKHTTEVLFKNRNTKDFCEEATHFIVLPGKPGIFLDYEVYSWYKHPKSVIIKIVSITMYDDFMEYEKARMIGLHSAKDADIPNIN